MQVDDTVKHANSDYRINALAAMSAGQPLEPYQYIPKEFGPFEVEVEISHCGMCHTDLHLINDDFGLTTFPLVPGHEIVGVVSQAGSAVQHLRVGQRVGIGPMAGACFSCEQCTTGRENICSQAQYLPMAREGGYATHVRVDSRVAFPVPDAIPSEFAAPLLCAGITVFAPLRRHVNGATRLGVVGIGGLGHLALQYGRAMGCHVTAFSSSTDKAEEAKQFGADEFVATKEEGALAARMSTCDFLLSTVTADLPWADYLNVLKPEGTLCILGIPDSDIRLPAIPLLFGQKNVVGSLIGSGAETRAMLEFSARHQVRPKIELFPMREANAALDRLSKNQVRYRVVLANDV
jgi:uncharacterized zinc-type alcohol dehydrogenase-like protein